MIGVSSLSVSWSIVFRPKVKDMDLAKHWRQRAARYRLEGQRHRESGEVRFPPEQVGGQAAEVWEPYDIEWRGNSLFLLSRSAACGWL